MRFSDQLKDDLSTYFLLNHPFYRAWMKGELSLDKLKQYAVQYLPHVEAFPRYVSAVHSFCETEKWRKHLLENLMEEEGATGGKDHPQLWKQFGMGLGLSDQDFRNSPIGERAKALVTTYWSLCRSSYAEGLAAVYAYEYQVPEIAKAKIEGLRNNYRIQEPDTLAFFSVHELADKHHSESCAQMLDEVPPLERGQALDAGRRAGLALWDFLSEVHEGGLCRQKVN